jgi:hypothetical protein
MPKDKTTPPVSVIRAKFDKTLSTVGKMVKKIEEKAPKQHPPERPMTLARDAKVDIPE